MGTIHRWRWGTSLQNCLDGEATEARVATVARHVADCPDCAADMELFRRMKDVLSRVGAAQRTGPAVKRLRSHAARFSA